MRRRRFCLIVNPGAGLQHRALVDHVVERLRGSGAEVSIHRLAQFTAVREATREALLSGRFDAIVAAGGDGTIRQAAAELVGSPVPLGIIPAGTANVLAHEIGLKATPRAVAGMLLDGPTVGAACARANGEPFLLMVSAGFDARVVGALDHRLKGLMGKAAYAGPVLGALSRPVDTLKVTVDGRACEASWAVIANARHYGGGFVMSPRTGILQRGLEAILFRPRSRSILVRQLVSLAMGRLEARATAENDVEMIPCSRVTIASVTPVPTQIDGDVLGMTPLQVEAGADEIRLIVPVEAAVDAT